MDDVSPQEAGLSNCNKPSAERISGGMEGLEKQGKGEPGVTTGLEV